MAVQTCIHELIKACFNLRQPESPKPPDSYTALSFNVIDQIYELIDKSDCNSLEKDITLPTTNKLIH
ncbi:hypothetical protein [Phocaeicola faecalis]|uniref:hypothetical protein n=1 Tax=Phocaeicola faecalis TaxID=2786956 RepID=UPI001F410AF5|nr:hypothetical protein [Phocaeicola faecalis]